MNTTELKKEILNGNVLIDSYSIDEDDETQVRLLKIIQNKINYNNERFFFIKDKVVLFKNKYNYNDFLYTIQEITEEQIDLIKIIEELEGK